MQTDIEIPKEYTFIREEQRIRSKRLYQFFLWTINSFHVVPVLVHIIRPIIDLNFHGVASVLVTLPAHEQMNENLRHSCQRVKSKYWVKG